MIYSIAAIGSAAFIFVGYFLYSEARIERLQEANTILEQANETNQKAIKDLNANIAEIFELNKELKQSLDLAQKSKQTLVKTLSNHNLTKLSLEKPGLIEKRINDATKRKMGQLEEYTRNLSRSDNGGMRQSENSTNSNTK